MNNRSLYTILKSTLTRKSGRKFRYLYRELRQHHYLIRLSFVCVGVLFLLLGIIMIVTPGPGIVFIILGLGLIATFSSKLAHGLDRLEVYLLRVIKRRRKHKQ